MSGLITARPNVLIPSTKGALTNANYKSRTAKRRAADRWAAARGGPARDRPGGLHADTANTTIFTETIEADIVAWVIPTYSADRYDGLPPVTESGSIMSYQEAGQVARKALRVPDAERARR